MINLEKQELLEINGGGKIGFAVASIIGIGLTFIMGFVHGLVYPQKCS